MERPDRRDPRDPAHLGNSGTNPGERPAATPPGGTTPPPGSAAPPYHREDEPALETSERRTRGDRRSIGSLLTDLTREVRTLVSKEAALVREDLSDRVSRAESGAAALGTGGVIALASLPVLLMGASFALNLWLEMLWLSFLIVGGVAAVIGLITMARGRAKLKAGSLAPERAAESLRRDAQLAREHTETAGESLRRSG